MLPFKELSSNSLISSQVEVSFLLSPGILLSLSEKPSEKLLLIAQVRSKAEISRGVLGHGLNSTDKERRDLLSTGVCSSQNHAASLLFLPTATFFTVLK